MADVAATLAGWSSTTGSNAPSGGTTIGTGLDDNLREIQGVIVRGLSHKGADIASATTTDIGAIEGLAHDITGTTTITGLGTVRAGIAKLLQFDGALTLTHNATSLILPGGANITTAAGDVALMFSEGSGNWRCYFYVKASGEPIVATAFTDTSAVVKGSADATKLLRFEVDGFTTATTRVLTAPNFDGTIATLAGTETFTNKTLNLCTADQLTLSTSIGGTARATQAQMEAASSEFLIVVPSLMHHHPGVIKGWIKGDFASGNYNSYNVSSVGDPGTGLADVNWNIDFSSANYGISTDCESTSNLYSMVDGTTTPTAGTTRVAVRNTGTGTLTDATRYYCAAWGDHA